MAKQHKWYRAPVSECTSPWPASRTLCRWSFHQLVPDPSLPASHRRLNLSRPEPRIPRMAQRSNTGKSFPYLWSLCSPAGRGALRKSKGAKNPTLTPTKEIPSGEVTPDHKPVPKKKKKNIKFNNSWPTKRGRRRREQGLVISTRSWIASALWRPPPLSCKSKQTESNDFPNRGRGTRTAQASSYAGLSSGYGRYQTTGSKHIFSCPIPCLPPPPKHKRATRQSSSPTQPLHQCSVPATPCPG